LIRNGTLYRAKENHLEEIPTHERLPESDPNRSLVDGILHGTPTPAPPECALPIFDWTSAVLTSVREGRSVRLASQGNGP
jgi:predicted dehydrogenase